MKQVLKKLRNEANKGIYTAHMYNINGLYTVRNTLCIQEKYKSIAARINRLTLTKDIMIVSSDISTAMRMHGTYHLKDAMNYFLRDMDLHNYMSVQQQEHKMMIPLFKHFHPIQCSIRRYTGPNPSKGNWMAMEAVDDPLLMLHVHGITLHLYHHESKRVLTMVGYVDNIDVESSVYTYLEWKHAQLSKKKNKSALYYTLIGTMSLRDIFLHKSSDELYSFYLNDLKTFKQKKLIQLVITFNKRNLNEKYHMLYTLLLDHGNIESNYIAYLLYDLLSSEMHTDTNEQMQIFACLPYNMKQLFCNAMKTTMKYTTRIMDIENEVIPYEQQICLMRCSDYVKQKAMSKLKEIKNRSDDSGYKAKQYLDGLLRIPFGHYYKENIVQCRDKNIELFKMLYDSYCKLAIDDVWCIEMDTLTNVDVVSNIDALNIKHSIEMENYLVDYVEKRLSGVDRSSIVDMICIFNNMIRGTKPRCQKICHSGRKRNDIISDVVFAIKWCYAHNTSLLDDILTFLGFHTYVGINPQEASGILDGIRKNNEYIVDYMNNVSNTLESAVYGHRDAKLSMQRIIAQWINGEQTGRCLGFEGPPGCGKTSFAKNGVAQCLRNNDGECRPFAFIALGGSSNASYLEGHSYTYVGSTWGKVADILMEKQCMNPIIFIDELDKVSRTEHGKEINGILTHLIDSTQNSEFYDKYFTGVPLDMSRALFIFSYNDASVLDKIVLDRIHRIQFDALTIDDKIVVAREHIVPQLLRTVGLVGHIVIPDDTVIHIIRKYTRESGVRRLKELLYDIVSQTNLEFMKSFDPFFFPKTITIEEVDTVHMRTKIPYKDVTPAATPLIGVVYGMWANVYKEGGILPIEVSLFPSDTLFEFKLTGMQGDVMKESMNVAKTVVWSVLFTEEQRQKIYTYCKKTKMQGIHVHCPEGATPKDGPSAGLAITIAMYSRLHSIFAECLVSNAVAMTGEINLRGEICAIGGLDCKLRGGFNVDIHTYYYPSENKKDFELFAATSPSLSERGTFHAVDHIRDVLPGIIVTK